MVLRREHHLTSIVTVGALCAKRQVVTWSSTDKVNATLSNGNLTCTFAAVGSCNSSNSYSTGKKYFEVLLTATDGASGNQFIGVQASGEPTSGGTQNLVSHGWCYASSGFTEDHGSISAGHTSTWSVGDVIGVAVDFDAGKIWFALNGSWIAGSPSAGTGATYTNITSGNWCAAIGSNTGTTVGGTGRFTNAAMGFTIPSGFASWAGS